MFINIYLVLHRNQPSMCLCEKPNFKQKPYFYRFVCDF